MFGVYWPYLFSALIVGLVSFASCQQDVLQSLASHAVSKEDQYAQSAEMIIATRNAPTSYFIDREGHESGFEYELAAEFARSQGKLPVFKIFDTTEEIIVALNRGEVHFAASGLSRTTQREKKFSFGPVYQNVQVYVTCHRHHSPRSLADLIGRNTVLASESSYIEILEDSRKKLPALTWYTQSELSTEDILNHVNEQEPGYDCGIADSSIYEMNRHLFPELRISFSIGESELAWPVALEHEFLARRMETWFHYAYSSQLVETLYEKYYSGGYDYNSYDVQIFRRRIRDRLPQYEDIIRQAAEETSLPFELLAAVAYQESHWDPNSISQTGVRGFMMLTIPTAKSLGVTDRLDAKQSMLAGAQYLKSLIDRFPGFIPREDRLWFGLASYNVGYYHLQDARRLAIDKQKNPNSWRDVKSVLPLLSNKQYYSRLRYGYARGREPVAFVKNIRAYQKILAAHVHQNENDEEDREKDVATH
ncbi:MAG: membrane-bound lytic murein transglycosylase MltF [Oligoflexus sp.]